jgi:hypothetical protein
MYTVMSATLALGIPAACVVAILKYRLYGIDVVISKTVAYAVLAAFLTAVYVLLVVGAGTLAGSGGRPSLGLSILATAVVAVAFQPVGERAQRFANRLVYGKRATPYQALSQLSERMASTYATEDLLPTMATIVAEATGAARADVWLRDGDELRAVASCPADAGSRPAIALAGGEFPAGGGADRRVPVMHHAELLGALSITKNAGMPSLRPRTSWSATSPHWQGWCCATSGSPGSSSPGWQNSEHHVSAWSPPRTGNASGWNATSATARSGSWPAWPASSSWRPRRWSTTRFRRKRC